MDTDFDDRWITIDEAANYLGIKPVTLRGWIKKDPLFPAHKMGKLWRFRYFEIDEWIMSGKSSK